MNNIFELAKQRKFDEVLESIKEQVKQADSFQEIFNKPDPETGYRLLTLFMMPTNKGTITDTGDLCDFLETLISYYPEGDLSHKKAMDDPLLLTIVHCESVYSLLEFFLQNSVKFGLREEDIRVAMAEDERNFCYADEDDDEELYSEKEKAERRNLFQEIIQPIQTDPALLLALNKKGLIPLYYYCIQRHRYKENKIAPLVDRLFEEPRISIIDALPKTNECAATTDDKRDLGVWYYYFGLSNNFSVNSNFHLSFA